MSETETQTTTPAKPAYHMRPAHIWYNKWAGGDREDSYSNTAASFLREDVVRMVMNANISMTFHPPPHQCPTLQKTVSPETNLQTIETIWVVLDPFHDKIEHYILAELKRLGLDRKRRKLFEVRVLQHRSVAFVTYADEANAQFAKEAMACQSMDNDEILNVRWATEDPNPQSKLAEKRRLEDIGSAAIANKLDPRMVDAVRHIRALEDEEAVPEPASPPEKRQKLIEPEAEPEPEPEPEPSGILSAQTLEGIRYLAEVRRQQEKSLQTKSITARPAQTGLGGLGGYASDEEDD
ncbi:procyclic acidic repetitive domain-containing protein [Rhizoctonia solani AG-1 IA]|uniref:Procyclic acidic repetitive domain-containing protein n=1 Tax=Thanatephorus cucumeris (strain AG1-IA) TaxID=983506 RepID=L8WSQ7_THACA|nr:procyclic acidic repetitive domain-containing protein [Rhizoctonia solani AG-1 IA]